MNAPSFVEFQALAPQLPAKIPYLKMLVLFGSRSRGDFHAASDWDFAALYDEDIRRERIKENVWNSFEVPSIISQYFGISDDKIDVVELNRASSLISHFVARDGQLLYEREAGEFERFRERSLLERSQVKKIHQDNLTTVRQFLQRGKA